MRPSQCSSLGQTPTDFFFRSQQLDENDVDADTRR